MHFLQVRTVPRAFTAVISLPIHAKSYIGGDGIPGAPDDGMRLHEIPMSLSCIDPIVFTDVCLVATVHSMLAVASAVYHVNDTHSASLQEHFLRALPSTTLAWCTLASRMKHSMYGIRCVAEHGCETRSNTKCREEWLEDTAISTEACGQGILISMSSRV